MDKSIAYATLKNVATDYSISEKSEIFDLLEIPDYFGIGKSGIFIITSGLLPSNSLRIEFSDSFGVVIPYHEFNYSYDPVNNFYKNSISVTIDSSVSSGIGNFTIIYTGTDKKTYKFSQAILIDTNRLSISTTKFYKFPKIEINPITTFLVGETPSIQNRTLTGSCRGMSLFPTVNSVLNGELNFRTDYRIITDASIFTKDIENFYISFTSASIYSPYSQNTQSLNIDSRKVIKVINDKEIIIEYPIILRSNGKDLVVNIQRADFSVNYNAAQYDKELFKTSSFQTKLDFDGSSSFKKSSYADITYLNLDSFCGGLSKHKVYRKSLQQAGDFDLIYESDFSDKEILKDSTSPNRKFQRLGEFFNLSHIQNYIYTSSNDVILLSDSSSIINGLKISGSNFDGSDYLIFKVNSTEQRTNVYVPYNADEYINTSGSSYESNFIKIEKDFAYEISFDAKLVDKNTNVSMSLDFYITSSLVNQSEYPQFSSLYGAKLGSLEYNKPTKNKNFGRVSLEFQLPKTTYGTLVIVPKHFNSCIISDLSITPKADNYINPSVFNFKIPFPVSQAGEIFEVKSELYGLKNELIDNQLKTVQIFDVSGSTTPPELQNSVTFQNVQITQNLVIDGNLTINGSTSIEIASTVDTSSLKQVFYNPTENKLYYLA